MPNATYTEITAKSALNRVQGMPFAWSLNPYRGCHHACTYCYARVTHAFLGLNTGSDFEQRIFVKTNLAEVLRADLRRPAWTGEGVAIGTATDPYQPAEGHYKVTRACLEVLAAHPNAASVTTKGTMVVRDIDVLQTLVAQAHGSVHMSIITLDDAVWRAMEPGTPPPRQRLRAVKQLAYAGVPVGISLAPVLPKLTDSAADLDNLIAAAADHGAQWVWTGTLHLEPAVRHVLVSAVERSFPQVAADYTRVYGASGSAGGARYTPSRYVEALEQRIAELQQRHGLGGPHERRSALAEAPALPVYVQERLL